MAAVCWLGSIFRELEAVSYLGSDSVEKSIGKQEVLEKNTDHWNVYDIILKERRGWPIGDSLAKRWWSVGKAMFFTCSMESISVHFCIRGHIFIYHLILSRGDYNRGNII